ncbi:MAG: hypothetical protein ACFFAO_09640 [Candidatus Hermodarchaeota archaeon]
MFHFLQDLLILTDRGISVWNKIQNTDTENQLVGMLMIALNNFAEEISTGGLSNFEISKLRFSLLKKDGFLFIASSSIKIKEKKILTELKQVMHKFFDKYSNTVLKSWNGDLSLFSDFEEVLKNNKKELMTDFISQHWR